MASAIETAIRSVVEKGVVTIADFNRKRMRDADNPYLTGIHTPVESETLLEDLAVTGTIPAALNGLYARNGPNPIGGEQAASYHWFLGDGMVHGIRLQGGRALWYRNRWVRSSKVSEALGEPPAPGTRHSRSDNANTNVQAIGGRLFALVEAGANPVELSADLMTVAHNPFDGTLTVPYSAHPHFDPETGEAHAITYEGAPDGRVWHVVTGADGKVTREEPIAVSDGPSIHDCAITASNVLVFDLPVTFSIERLIKGFRFPLGWNPKHPSRVGVLGKSAPGSSIVWCDVEPCYVFHPCNAYETGDGRIIADVIAHADMFRSSTMGPDAQSIRFERWTIDPAARTVARAVIDPEPQEFPRLDERRTGKPYRYARTVGVQVGPDLIAEGSSILYCHDLEAGTRRSRDFGAAKVAGEFVFVPYGPGEQDGWLVGLVGDRVADSCDLHILDAADFTGPPVAVVHIPLRIPPGFHGNWIPA